MKIRYLFPFSLIFSVSTIPANADLVVTTVDELNDCRDQYFQNGAFVLDSVGNVSFTPLSESPESTSFPYLLTSSASNKTVDTRFSITNTGDISFQGNGTYGGINSSGNMGGYLSNSVVFSNTGSISFSDFSGYTGGAINCPYGGLIFSDINGNITFENNKSSSEGGAIQLRGNQADMPGNLTVHNLQGDFIAKGNSSTYGGVLFSISGHLDFSKTGDLIFENNMAQGNSYSNGGALYSGGVANHMSFVDTGNMVFRGNEAPYCGGAIYIDFTLLDENIAPILFQNTGDILFENNQATYGGAISALNYRPTSKYDIVFENTGKISFIGNSAVVGGGIYAGSLGSGLDVGVRITGAESVLFDSNYATKDGGGGSAIYSTNLYIANCGDVSFTNNRGVYDGNAVVYLSMMGKGNNVLSADRGDILFRNNLPGVNEYVNLAINAWGMDETDLNVRAAEGRKVSFYDPIIIEPDAEPEDAKPITWDLNKGDGYTGTVVFSGEDLEDPDMAVSTIKGGDLVVHQGSLVLQKGASLLVEGEGHGFSQYAGILDISNAKITAPFIRIGGTPEGDIVTIRPGEHAILEGDEITMNGNIIVDFAYHMTETGFSSPGPVEIIAGQFLLGGSLGIHDTETDTNYYYADNRWAAPHSFTLLHDAQQIHDGDFDSVASLATGSDRIDSPYTYNGTWSREWIDSDGDGTLDQLNVVWTPDTVEPPVDPVDPDDPNPPTPPAPIIRDILPELAGGLAMNTMWSSASNTLSTSNAALGNLGVTRFKMEPKNNYWIKGLGDFTSHGSVGTRDGYDYNGGGYAVGADRKITTNAILGLSFGNLYGKNYSRSFVGDVDQTSEVALLYGGWRKEINPKNALTVTGSAGYGWTKNKMDSFHTGNWSHGEWDNRTLFGTLKGQWDHALKNNWSVSAFLGLEYTDVTQDSFTEKGWDARRFDEGHMRNLSLPVGMGVSKQSSLNGMGWVNSLSVSYVPDVYRENPSAGAERLMNGYRWTAKGIAPDRNAVRINYDSTLAISPQWTAYAGYEFEGRNRSVYHRVNLGVSFSY